MNKTRRKQLRAIYFQLQELQEQLQTVKEEEQGCYYNLPENLQETENGRKSEDAIGHLDDALFNLEELIYNIAEILDY